MKRILALLLPFVLLCALAACKSGVPIPSTAPSDLSEGSAACSFYSSRPESDNESKPALENAPQSSERSNANEVTDSMEINVSANGYTIVYELNGSLAAKDLYAQLPLTLEVEDFGTNEKVFYPPEKLDTAETPLAKAGSGTLAYYAPWGDVVMFYESYNSNGSLYALGRVISGEEYIKNLSGTIKITAT